MEQPTLQQDSPAWILYVWASFLLSTFMLGLGIYVLPVNLWIKGYFAMGIFFNIGATIALAKTVRDQHESQKLVNRLSEVKTEKMLAEFNLNR